MKTVATLLLVVALAPCGCVSRSKARAEARVAFDAGQQQALMQIREAGRTSIRIVGSVRNPDIPWSDGLTLAKVIVAADYTGLRDPKEILVTRQREQFRVDPRELLNGADYPLEPGDTVEIRQ